MKQLILTIVVFINTGSLIAQNVKFDTLVTITWNGSAWQNYSRTINTYDAECRLQTALHQNWDAANITWVNYSIKVYSYVRGNYINEILTRFWSNNAWMDNDRLTYTYDVFFKTLSITEQTWSSDHWSNYISTNYKYDSYGYADSVLVQVSYADRPFENSSLTIDIHNSDSTLQQTITKNWNKAAAVWDNYSRYSIVYNNDKKIDTATTTLWSAASWLFNTRSVYTYTGTGKLFFYITQHWQTSQWINQLLYTNYYDNNSFVSNILVQSWDGFDFENYTETSYKNNNDGSIYQYVSQIWVDAINTWINDLQETYSYAPTCALPLKLLLFTATKNNNMVNLSWQTADEMNLSHFTLQRNENGKDFTSLVDISAENGTGTNSYLYADNIENITADTIYYRLRIIDKDGSETYSKTVSVTLSGSVAVGFKVYPNPAKDQLFIAFNTQNTSKAEIYITDILGRLVYSNTLNNNVGNNVKAVNISALSKGEYFILVVTDKDIERTKFLKQ
jgi:hypothetical protein